MLNYIFERNTFKSIPKNDDNDKLEIEIGDSKQDSFFPQLKIMRWDNEVNASFRLMASSGVVSTYDNKIIWKNDEMKAFFYDKNKNKEYEFEIILEKKPPTNTIEMNIDAKGLDFYYQPPLTKEEIAKKYIRPDDVIGSYAAYHKTKGVINKSNKKNYATGKVFHIYRPEIIDNVKNRVWGNIDIKNNILTIEIPQKFLDECEYPIIIDPRFGWTSKGASIASIENYIWGSRFSIGEDGSGLSMTGWVTVSTAAKYLKMAIYDNGSGDTDATTSLIENGQTDEITVSAGIPATEETADFSTSPSFVSGTYYRLLAWSSLGNGGAYLHYDSDIGGAYGYAQSRTYGSWPSPSNHTAVSGFRLSIYCTYELSGQEYSQTCPEALTFSPNIQKGIVLGSFAESLSIADSSFKNISSTKSETLSFSDSVSKTWVALRTFSESLSFALTEIDTWTAIRTITESFSISDTLGTIKSIARILTESLSLSDALIKQMTIIKPESLSISDTIYKNTSLIKSESFSISDSVDVLKALVRMLSESLSVSDSLNKSMSVIKTESFSFSDSFSRVWTAQRNLSESMSFSDSLGISRAIVKALGESLSFTLSTYSVWVAKRSISESFSISDSLTKDWTAYISLSESASISVSLISAVQKNISESIGLSDYIEKTISLVKGEALTLAISLTKEWEAYKTMNESLSFALTESSIWTAQRIFSESITISLMSQSVTSYIRSFSETLSISDSLETMRIIVRTLVESLSFSISMTTTFIYVVVLTETLNINMYFIWAERIGRYLHGIFNRIAGDDVSDTFSASKTIMSDDITIGDGFK